MSKAVDWQEIKARYEAGVSIAQLARDTGATRSQIGERKRKEGWTASLQGAKSKAVWKDIGRAREAADRLREWEAKKRKGPAVEKEAGESVEGSNLEPHAIGKAVAPAPPEPELDALDREIARELALLADHQSQAGRARAIASSLLERLEAVLIHGECENIIRIKTKHGVTITLPFLGQRESISDALIKVSSALQKLIPLERQAHGLLSKSESDQIPPVSVNIGVFGAAAAPQRDEIGARKGKVIESESSRIRDQTSHLDS